MIIVAWNGSGDPSAIFNVDVFKKVLSVFFFFAQQKSDSIIYISVLGVLKRGLKRYKADNCRSQL